MADGGKPGRVLVVCDAYPAQPGARSKAWEWHARGCDVRVLAADPQPPGSLPSGYVEIEEGWVDGIPVYLVRFAPPVRAPASLGHGAEPLLGMALDRALRGLRPDLLCLVLGPYFGAIPLRKAAEHKIAVEMVDSASILTNEGAGRPRRWGSRGLRRSAARRGRRSGSAPTPLAIDPEGRPTLHRALRSEERR